MNVRTPAMQVYLAAIVTPTPKAAATIGAAASPRPIATAIPTATPEPLPSMTPTATPIPDYQVIDRVAECTHGKQPPQIRVIVQDQFGRSVSGKVIWITWDGGSDRFVTGLKPELDPGYGDFDMQPDQSYNVGVDKPTSVVVSGLRADSLRVVAGEVSLRTQHASEIGVPAHYLAKVLATLARAGERRALPAVPLTHGWDAPADRSRC